jgi:hypothetical protein
MIGLLEVQDVLVSVCGCCEDQCRVSFFDAIKRDREQIFRRVRESC